MSDPSQNNQLKKDDRVYSSRNGSGTVTRVFKSTEQWMADHVQVKWDDFERQTCEANCSLLVLK